MPLVLFLYFLSIYLDLLEKKSNSIKIFPFLQKRVLPRFLPMKRLFQNISFRKKVRSILLRVFLWLTSLYMLYQVGIILKKGLLMYILYQERQVFLLDKLAEKLRDLILSMAEAYADEMIKFLRYHNLRDRLTRDEWVNFFQAMFLDSGEAIGDFRDLLKEMLKYTFKNPEIRFNSLKQYDKCLVEPFDLKIFPTIEHKRVLHLIKKIDKKYWRWSIYALEKYLKKLLELYAQSEFTNIEIAKAIFCLQKELARRVATW